MRRYTFSNVIYFKFQNILYIYVVIVQNCGVVGAWDSTHLNFMLIAAK